MPSSISPNSIHRCKLVVIVMVLGKLGPGKLGPSPIWRQIGPRTFWGPICHFLANRAPADWAPWRQIGPRQIGPRQIGPLGGKLGPMEILLRQIGPRRIGPRGEVVRYTYKKMYIPDQTYSPTLRPKGAQKPSK